MIDNFKTFNKKDIAKFFAYTALILLFVAWFCTPPANKLIQICYWGNNAKFFISKIMNSSNSSEYIFYRNNSIYLANMYNDKTIALKEIEKAFKSLPENASDEELKSLYRVRANIKIAAEDYKGALSDFMNSGVISFTDSLKVAMLYKVAGNYKDAMSYCNYIIKLDSSAYAGYACVAELYTSLGRYDYALKIWDLAIDRRKTNARAYVDRAKTKKLLGDINGYNTDIKKAKELSPTIDLDESIIEDTLHPRYLNLSIK